MRRFSIVLGIASLVAGCDARFGIRDNAGGGGGGGGGGRVTVLRPAARSLSDAYAPPGVDAGRPDATTVQMPDAYTAPPPDAYATPGCGSTEEQEELRLTNAARAMDGDGPLRCDTLMTQVARAHSQDMCDRNFFDHTNPDGDSPFDRMTAAGVTYGTAGENIAAGQMTPASVHDSWMNSPGHRANILNGAYGRIGIGVIRCPTGYRIYWTQVFAN